MNRKEFIFRHGEQHCPVCKKLMDSATPLMHDARLVPKSKDLSICGRCGELLQFEVEDDNIYLVKAEKKELEAAKEEDFEQYVKLTAFSAMIKHKYTAKNN